MKYVVTEVVYTDNLTELAQILNRRGVLSVDVLDIKPTGLRITGIISKPMKYVVTEVVYADNLTELAQILNRRGVLPVDVLDIKPTGLRK